FDSCVVECEVEAPKSLDRFRHQRLDLSRIGDIGLPEDGLASHVRDEAHDLLAAGDVDVSQDDIGAPFGEGQRGGSSDTATRSRHQGGPSLKGSGRLWAVLTHLVTSVWIDTPHESRRPPSLLDAIPAHASFSQLPSDSDPGSTSQGQWPLAEMVLTASIR